MLDLAESLGADVKAAKIAAAKKRFEKAAARLRKAAKSKPDIKVLIGSASQDLFYVSARTSPRTWILPGPRRELRRARRPTPRGFFEELSWENVDKYHADIIMMDNRTVAIQPAA